MLKGGVCGFVCCNISESSSEFVEQLGLIGLPHDVNVQSLFDPTGTGNDLTCFFFSQPKCIFFTWLSNSVCIFVGQCCAHLQCAAWSEGVCLGEGQSLLYVDKAIDLGSTQVSTSSITANERSQVQVESSFTKSHHVPPVLPLQVCAFCHRLGASLRCRQAGCGWSYHFPCAAASGAHQDWNQRRILCTRHSDTGTHR